MGTFINLTGQKFGSLVVVGRDPSPTSGEAKWLCDCDACGKKWHTVKGSLLRDGRAKSCGCLIGGALDLVDARFGRWLVIERSEAPLTRDGSEQTTRSAWWLCRCDCGEVKPVSAQALRSGMSVSCGCLQKERSTEVHAGHDAYEKDPGKRHEYGVKAHKAIRRYGSNAPRPRHKFKDTLHNKEWLQDKYADRFMSKGDIGALVGCSTASVSTALTKFGITRVERSSKEPVKVRQALTGEHATLSNARLEARNVVKYKPCAVCEGIGKHVNHKDRNPWNNDPSNLEMVCVKCHNRQHAMEVKVAFDWIREKLEIPFIDLHLEARKQLLESNLSKPEEVQKIASELRHGGFPEEVPSPSTDAILALDNLINVEVGLDSDGVITPQTPIGTKTCASFFPGRYRARYQGSISAWDAWHSEDLLKKAIEMQLACNSPVTPERVLKAIIFQHRTPSIFRPATAKYIYQTYGNKGVVWDPCAGYGGRLMGAMAAGVSKYIGTDIEPETVAGNRVLAESLGVVAQCLIHLAKAEDFNPGEPLDLVFTSPPYFNLEVYGEASSEAFESQGSASGWVAGFLEPLMTKAFFNLKSGGHLVLNLPKKAVRGIRLDEVAQEIASKIGFTAMPTIFMPFRRRGKDRSTYKTEPVLIWVKPYNIV